MAMTNAEKQRAYRQRLKNRSPQGSREVDLGDPVVAEQVVRQLLRAHAMTDPALLQQAAGEGLEAWLRVLLGLR